MKLIPQGAIQRQAAECVCVCVYSLNSNVKCLDLEMCSEIFIYVVKSSKSTGIWDVSPPPLSTE